MKLKKKTVKKSSSTKTSKAVKAPKPKKKYYFGKEAHNAVVEYQSTDDRSEKNKIYSLISSSLNDGRWCSADPLCMNRANDISLTGSLATCHNCTLLPETSCEVFNRFLDRGLLFGTEKYRNIGFFKEDI